MPLEVHTPATSSVGLGDQPRYEHDQRGADWVPDQTDLLKHVIKDDRDAVHPLDMQQARRLVESETGAAEHHVVK